ncbi:MAG: DUF4097 domain-containing protein [Myxococcales bacterium]|nr:DUF4097 domain-containing protein [Myxococcales bacterium]
MRLALLPLVCSVAGCVFQVGETYEAFVDVEIPSEVTTLALEVEWGDVTVVAGDRARLDARYEWQGGDGNSPVLIRDERSTEATYRFECPDTRRGCGVTVELALPPSVTVASIVADLGAVQTTDLQTELTIHTDAGSIEVDGHEGLLDLQSEFGAIEVTDACSAELRATTGTGEIELELCERPDVVEAKAEFGSIDVVVPVGAYAVDASTDFGSVEVDGLDVDPEADASIVARTSTGEVTVRGR